MKKALLVTLGIVTVGVAVLRWYNETVSLWACTKDDRLFDYNDKLTNKQKRRAIRFMSPNTFNLVNEALREGKDDFESGFFYDMEDDLK